jgi:hypothetical protein
VRERRKQIGALLWAACVGVVVIVIVPRACVALPLTKWDKFSTQGNWNVYKAPQGTATTVKCVAVYGTNYTIQLTGDGLTLAYGMKGGIDSVRWRLDDGEPHDAVVLGKGRDIGAFVFADEGEHVAHGFAEIVHGKQLHIEVTKLVGEPETIDLTLAGIRATMDVLWGPDCR